MHMFGDVHLPCRLRCGNPARRSFQFACILPFRASQTITVMISCFFFFSFFMVLSLPGKSIYLHLFISVYFILMLVIVLIFFHPLFLILLLVPIPDLYSFSCLFFNCCYRCPWPPPLLLIATFHRPGENAAGSRLAHMLAITGAQNILVVVSRW